MLMQLTRWNAVELTTIHDPARSSSLPGADG
jgi:hypothetical protein